MGTTYEKISYLCILFSEYKYKSYQLFIVMTKKEVSVEDKLRTLYALQLIDCKIDELRNVRGELPLEVEDLEDEVAGLESRAERLVNDIDKINEAKEIIRMIVTEFEEGKVYTGKVVSIKEFGAFVEFAPGKEGMVHISKVSKERINNVEDVLTLGDIVKTICLGKDKMGRISFSIKDVPAGV